ncbi:SanA/YdcF family protein [Micromonospora zhanjiangensis]|uniref:Vancomycin high temperature exclusion protein n=1 Tax=Micromonospora zhanjiangensis TaxID=1522057 RepID=A0ABV8KLL6_9ACTN
MRRRRLLLTAAGIAVAGLVLVSAPWLWTEVAAAGHEYDVADAPVADVVIVLGTEVAADRQRPGDRLTGRLDAAAELVRAGRVRAVLVSGDGGGASGDEPTVMTDYLAGLGVDRRQVVSDRYGLDTYDSCVRARDVYGVTSALIVTQDYHLSRAVALCRHVGLATEGVTAGCPGCSAGLLAEKAVRDYFACGKAAWDAVRDRPPAVQSPADPSVREALRAT